MTCIIVKFSPLIPYPTCSHPQKLFIGFRSFASPFSGNLQFFLAWLPQTPYFHGCNWFFPSLTSSHSCLANPITKSYHHLFALLLLPDCQELVRKLNNHADRLCYKFMISTVSWTLGAQQPCYSLLLGWPPHSTEQLFPPHPHQMLPFHPHSPQHQHTISPPTAEKIVAIRREPPPLLQICLHLYSLELHLATQKNPPILSIWRFDFTPYCLWQDLISSPGFLFSVQPINLFLSTYKPTYISLFC